MREYRALALLIGTMAMPQLVLAQPDASNNDTAQRALAAGAQAQRAALDALQAAHDAVAATLPPEREAALQRALDAAAAARRAADAAQQAVASLQGTAAGASVAKSGTVATASNPAPPVAPAPNILSSATVSGSIKAGQVDDTASLSLSWTAESLQRTRVTDLTFSAPTSSTSNATRLGTLDGLADAASVKLSQAVYFPVDPMHPDEKFWMLGASARIGKKDFTYKDPMSFGQSEVSKKPVALAAFAGYVPNDRLMLLAKFEAQRKYVEGTEGVRCRPAAAGQIECMSGPIGAPVRKSARIYTFGLRYLGKGYNVAPSINYDHAEKVRGIDLPVYLFGAGDGKPAQLSGGIGASWRSDTRDTAFYVFVGSPFAFWGL